MKYLAAIALGIALALVLVFVLPGRTNAYLAACPNPFDDVLWMGYMEDDGDHVVEVTWSNTPGCRVDAILRVYAWENGTMSNTVVGWDDIKAPEALRVLAVTDPVGGRPLLAELRTTAGTRILSSTFMDATGLILP